ncbi:MAG TPA: hypothetical protein PLZ51_25285 [Aggregatilineales bacterium]|nr:hypothetical protein [Aggregatilineales bacterium]
MRFTLYTEKTVSECIKTLNERIESKKNSKTGVRGRTNKNGEFSLWSSARVLFLFKRITQMNAKVTREGGNTIIQGFVPDGMSPYWLTIAGVVLIAVCVGFLVLGDNFLAVIGLVAGIGAYVMLRGDYRNSEFLLVEVEKTLKASPNPPKKKS